MHILYSNFIFHEFNEMNWSLRLKILLLANIEKYN